MNVTYKMKRKISEQFYKDNGFVSKRINGRYTADCTLCGKELQNTSISRLSLHRRTCDKKRSGESTPNDELDSTGMEETIISNVKVELTEDPIESQTLLNFQPENVKDSNGNTENFCDSIVQVIEAESVDHSNDFNNVEILKEYLNDIQTFEPPKPLKRSHVFDTLNADKIKAEIKKFRSKTQYLKTMTDNLQLERTLILLKTQKLHLEINALCSERK